MRDGLICPERKFRPINGELVRCVVPLKVSMVADQSMANGPGVGSFDVMVRRPSSKLKRIKTAPGAMAFGREIPLPVQDRETRIGGSLFV